MRYVRRVSLVGREAGERLFVLIQGDEGRPVIELRDALQRIAPERTTITFQGRALPLSGKVENVGLHDGAVLAIGRGPTESIAPLLDGHVLRVVGGPDAGLTIPLGREATLVGRGHDADLQLRDHEVSRSHAAFEVVAGEGVFVVDQDSANGTFREGELVRDARVAHGDVVRLGSSLVEVGEADRSTAIQLDTSQGTHGFHRRFRSGTTKPPNRVRFPRAPHVGDLPALNLLLTIAPGAAFAIMALALDRPQLLFFAALSPLLSVSRTVVQRRTYRRKRDEAQSEYAAGVKAAEEELASRLAEERRYRRLEAPDPARIVEAARLPTRDLWSRRPEDEDFLSLRIGSANAPSEVTVDIPDAPEPHTPEQPWLPVSIPLTRVGGIALTGALERLRPVAAACLLQAAVLHAPADLRIVVLSGPDGEATWSFARWLPHVRDDPEAPFVLMGTDSSSRTARMEELRRLIAARREAASATRNAVFRPRVLVVYDDVSARIQEGAADLLRDGPGFGVHALALDLHQVPQGCDASVVIGSDEASATVEQIGRPPVHMVLPDGVSPSRCESVAQRLAPMTLVGEDRDTALPSALRLLGVLDLAATPDAVAKRWRARSPRTTAAIGAGPEGAATIDLTRDGPHMLVAGTTRSGKSEFIKTLVASLAIENHPDDLAFLFIDFKGGGDYQLLKRLPHAVALATSQDDDAEFDRALLLLDAELARRQNLVKSAMATTIEGYLAARRTSPARLAPLPRLLLVVDEFAELKSRRPEQLERLVSVARTGAAFGLHLLLATQRPSGVVTGQIDANVGLRVCFRVAKEEESRDVVDAPYAARIAERHRGRAFLRSPATPLVEVQTARVAGARLGSQAAEPLSVEIVGWDRLGHVPADVAAVGEVADPETDLADVVDAAVEAAAALGWEQPAVPWPEALPDRVSLDDLRDVPIAGPAVAIGLVDDPSRQRRLPLTVDFGQGHIAVAGSSQTGRTTALRSFITASARQFTPEQAHVVALDFAGGALRAAGLLPHCVGAAVEDWELADRLLRELEEQVKLRREQFAAKGWADLGAQHAGGATPLPWLVLVIDGWDTMVEEGTKLAIAERVPTLLARGASVGLVAVVAGERATASGAIGRHLRHRYVLRFIRKHDAELQGLHARQVPEQQPPGRAVEVASGRLVQFAEIEDPDGLGQAAAFGEAIAAGATDMSAAGPRKVARLEAKVLLGPLLEPPKPPSGATLPVLVGIEAATQQPLWLDMPAVGGTFFVAGPPGSGRSTALVALARSTIACGIEVVCVASAPSPLCELEGLPGARVVLATAPELDLVRSNGTPVLLVVDDLELLEDGGAIVALRDEVEGLVIIGAATLPHLMDGLRGLPAVLRRARTGMVLTPSSYRDGTAFGGRLAPSMVFDGPAGRGVVGVEGTILGVVQVPIA